MKRSTKTILLISICLISFGIVLSSIGYFTGANPLNILRSGMWNAHRSHLSQEYNESGAYTVSGDRIDSVELYWVSGSINIETYEGDKIRFTEKSDGNISEIDALRYSIDDNTLCIYFSEDKWKNISQSSISELDKDLTVEIPENMLDRFYDLSIDCVSSNVRIDNLRMDSLEVNSVSANVTGNNLSVNSAEANFVSGNLDIEFLHCPQEFSFESVSGGAVIYLPENSGFNVETSLGEGRFISDFPMNMSDIDAYVIGDGRSEFEVFALSGTLTIKQGKRP